MSEWTSVSDLPPTPPPLPLCVTQPCTTQILLHHVSIVCDSILTSEISEWLNLGARVYSTTDGSSFSSLCCPCCCGNTSCVHGGGFSSTVTQRRREAHHAALLDLCNTHMSDRQVGGERWREMQGEEGGGRGRPGQVQVDVTPLRLLQVFPQLFSSVLDFSFRLRLFILPLSFSPPSPLSFSPPSPSAVVWTWRKLTQTPDRVRVSTARIRTQTPDLLAVRPKHQPPCAPVCW